MADRPLDVGADTDAPLTVEAAVPAHERHVAFGEPGKLPRVVEVGDYCIATSEDSSTSSSPATASRAPGTRRASASASAGRSSAFDGMHA
jgi:hypothetical protein